jgi:cytochrome c
MSKHLFGSALAVSALLTVSFSIAQDNSPALGIEVTQSQIESFDLIIGPNGEGLPVGNGSAAQGERVFQARCQSCHGADGEGLSGATTLVGGSMQSEGPPLRTVGSYWPHATTVYDFIRRAMPADAPKSLTDTEVYQVTAYVLFLNGIVDRNEVLDQDNLADVRMPNADGFVDQSSVQ